jgi:hypothetical protein
MSPVAFLDVQLEPCVAAPGGLTLRFKVSPGAPEISDVTVLPYESEAGLSGAWRVAGVDTDDDDAPPVAARAALVEDSSDGTAWLVVGGEAGLRLTHEATGVVAREAYLVLAKGTVLGR